MKKIEAIVRPEKMEDVKEALNNIEVHGITMYQVMGCGTQHGMTEVVRGQHVDIHLMAKIKFEIVVSTDEWAEKAINAIIDSAYTGNVGDGKIFVYGLDNVIRIRTRDTGAAAINPPQGEES